MPYQPYGLEARKAECKRYALYSEAMAFVTQNDFSNFGYVQSKERILACLRGLGRVGILSGDRRIQDELWVDLDSPQCTHIMNTLRNSLMHKDSRDNARRGQANADTETQMSSDAILSLNASFASLKQHFMDCVVDRATIENYLGIVWVEPEIGFGGPFPHRVDTPEVDEDDG